MKKVVYTLILIAILGCKGFEVTAQTISSGEFTYNLEKLILNEKQVGKEYLLKEILPEEILEYKIAYLGGITNIKYKPLSFLYVATYTGLYKDSKKCKSIIAVYSKGVRLGHYYTGGAYEILPTIENNELVIKKDDEYCNQTTRINFKDSIPEKIFIKCSSDHDDKLMGDIYYFEKATN